VSIFIWLVSSLLMSIFFLFGSDFFNGLQSYTFLLMFTFFLYKQLTSRDSRTKSSGLLANFFSKRPKSEKLEVPKQTCEKCGRNKTKK